MQAAEFKRRRRQLMGMMGAGKSTVGRQLAEALSFEFRDSDQEIQLRTR